MREPRRSAQRATCRQVHRHVLVNHTSCVIEQTKSRRLAQCPMRQRHLKSQSLQLVDERACGRQGKWGAANMAGRGSATTSCGWPGLGGVCFRAGVGKACLSPRNPTMVSRPSNDVRIESISSTSSMLSIAGCGSSPVHVNTTACPTGQPCGLPL